MILPHNVFLGLGSNLGNKEENILKAVELIDKRIGKVVSLSSFFNTEPFGFISGNDFLNAACKVSTEHTPSKILFLTKNIEKELGRTVKSSDGLYEDRIIDIDILMYDDLVFENEELIIPHPHMHKRLFVLEPLAEIAGNTRHPVLMKTITELRNSMITK